MKILVTGATGHLGHTALETLRDLVPQEDLFALVRTAEKGSRLEEEGYQIRVSDYDDEQTLAAAFDGIDRLLFVSGSDVNHRRAQHENIVTAAKEAGVSYIAYTSFANAQQADSPLADDHKYTEKLIEDADIDHTFLRNNWYLDNEMPVLQAALKTGDFVHAGGSGQAGWMLRSEYAEIAGRAVSGRFDFPAVVELGGPLQNYQQLAQALQEASGEDLEVKAVDQAESAAFLEKNLGLPAEVAGFIAASQGIVASGDLAVPADDMEKYLGRPLLSTVASLKALLDLK
ncbi:NAD(P)H-binding protein [Lactobacillaceae bacterium L1_55_11]|nr:NAD(P)H-binding protein [Lactobacillaceae bacterium L1_55_11]